MPLWCAPENVRILTVNNEVKNYVTKITKILDDTILDDPIPDNKLRYSVDDADDSLGKKIRRAVDLKIPFIIIVGPKDAEENIVSIRLRDKEEKVKLADLAKYIKGI